MTEQERDCHGRNRPPDVLAPMFAELAQVLYPTEPAGYEDVYQRLCVTAPLSSRAVTTPA